VVDSGWFHTLKRKDVDLVAEAVARIEPNGIVSASGEFYEFDAIRAGDGVPHHRLLMADGDHRTRWAFPSPNGGKKMARGPITGSPSRLSELLHPLRANTNAFANGRWCGANCKTRYALEWIKLMVERGVAAAGSDARRPMTSSMRGSMSG